MYVFQDANPQKPWAVCVQMVYSSSQRKLAAVAVIRVRTKMRPTGLSAAFGQVNLRHCVASET